MRSGPIWGRILAVAAALLTLPAAASAAPPVNNNHDSGTGSLRAAIQSSSSGDTITIPSGIGTITLTTGALGISHPLTINGAGQSATTISGGGTQQIFNVFGTSSNLTLSDMTLTDAKANAGAAVSTVAPLTLTNVTASHNTSGGGGAYGAVFTTGPTLAISGSTFDTNTATFSNFGGQGGAVTFIPLATANGQQLSMTVTNSTFTGNSALGATSNVDGGGAIDFAPLLASFSNATASLSVSGSTFTSNTAGDPGGSHSGGRGAAIEATAGDAGGSSNHFDLTLDHDTFATNQANGGTNGGFGGAVEFDPALHGSSDTDMASVSETTFAGNSAGAGAAVSAGGGALELIPAVSGTGATSSATITGGSFSNNTVAATTATIDLGGAVAFRPFGSGADNASLTITGASFSGNSAGVGTTGLLSQGGAVFFAPAVSAGTTDTLSVARSSFSGDRAGSQGSDGEGGGIVFGASVTTPGVGSEAMTLDRDSFDHETAGGGGTAFGLGGALDVIPGSIGSASATVSNSTFSNDSAGGQSSGDRGAGGAVNLASGSASGSVLLRNDTFAGNQAGVGAIAPTSGIGGAVSVGAPGLAASFDNDTITGNSVGGTSTGGGVSGPASLVFQNTIVAGNSASTGRDCDTVTGASGGGNVESGTSCGFTGPGDHQNADPKLGQLADNGGGLQTLLPQPGSPALGAGLATHCPATDERGLARPTNAACDSGAVQVQRPSVSTGAASKIGATSATITLTAAPGDANGTLVVQYGTGTAYGHTITVKSLAARTAPGNYTIKLTGLKPSTTYHYRAAVSDGYGTFAGTDRTFKTIGRPLNRRRPKISGKPQAGHKLSCSKGSWTNQPNKFSYGWKRNGRTIKGAKRHTYRVRNSDRGRKLSCFVVASNAAGKSKPATSKTVRVR